MSDNLISNLNLLYKLSNILNDSEIDISIKKSLIECKNICVNQIKSDNLIKIFLNEINFNSNLNSNSSQLSPEQFDNLGNGLLRLMRISNDTPEINTNHMQIKNELKLSDGNIKVQIIKKKINE